MKKFFPSIFFLYCLCLTITEANSQDKASLKLKIEGKKLIVEGYIPDGYTQFSLRVYSDRNDKISRFTDLTPKNLEYDQYKSRYDQMKNDFWYPVVDLELQPGMVGICRFETDVKGEIYAGTPYFRTSDPITPTYIIPGNKLDYWENSLFIKPKEGNEIKEFYLQNTYPVLLRNFVHVFTLLSDDWGGKVALYADNGSGEVLLTEQMISGSNRTKNLTGLEELKGSGISKERLLYALEAAVDEGMRRQVVNPHSPMEGSFHTFYELEARTYRTAYWTWGGSSLVKMVLDASSLPEMEGKLDKKELLSKLERIGQLYLKYQVLEQGHPSRGGFLVIWTSRGAEPYGYRKWIGTSDSGVIVRWALIPLFLATGDTTYLEAAKFWAEEQDKLMDEHKVLPHKYYYDLNEFNPGILDETGWDPEGHAALYEVTNIDLYREIGKRYMDHRMVNFGRDDGMWQRNYNIETGESTPTAHMTRGTGWAMEGLLAMNRMYPNDIYLDYARKMADHLVKSQLPEGSWPFIFTESPEKFGITEKGTALWSLLFYQLYEATKDKQYLSAARKALTWCLDNQYTGPDPEALGGIFGSTRASAVGYRYYYDVSCAYTTGFFGLAILEELKLMKKKK